MSLWFCLCFIVISMGMGVRFGLSWWWWRPLLPPSAALCLLLTLWASGCLVHLLIGPFSLTVNHLDIRQRRSPGPLEAELNPQEVSSQWMGVWFRRLRETLCYFFPGPAVFFTCHLFVQHQTEFHRKGDVDRRLQAWTNANRASDRESVADCRLLYS